MNRILLLILVAGATFLIILFAVKPELIGDIWLWLIGLSGVIIKSFHWLTESIKKMLKGDDSSDNDNPQPDATPENVNTMTGSNHKSANKPFAGLTIKVMRYWHNDDTTIGLLFFEDQFFCYTLEDTYHKEKIPDHTRIPAGTYMIKFLKEETGLTKRMRQHYDWFKYQLELQNVPQFTNIYIHNGGRSSDTSGCILVSDSLNTSKKDTFLSNSRETFRRFYQFVSEKLTIGTPVRIIVYDEQWMNNLN